MPTPAEIAAAVAGGAGGVAVANVGVGALPATGLSKLKDLPTDAPFEEYLIMGRYEGDKRRYMMGVASPGGFNGQQAAFVQLASQTLLWVVDWTTARWKELPEIPDPEQVDEGWVLLDVIAEPTSINAGPDGTTPFYRISGTYVYGAKSPDSNVWKDVSIGLPFWLEDQFQRTIPLSKLQRGLIEDAGGTTTNVEITLTE